MDFKTGHYAPVLVDHILEMNFQLESSKQPGRVPIPIKSLGIGNGLTNPLVQYLSYITYAQSNPVESSPKFTRVLVSCKATD
jgi:carboxypeptidase C (cathepsin A)